MNRKLDVFSGGWQVFPKIKSIDTKTTCVLKAYTSINYRKGAPFFNKVFWIHQQLKDIIF